MFRAVWFLLEHTLSSLVTILTMFNMNSNHCGHLTYSLCVHQRCAATCCPSFTMAGTPALRALWWTPGVTLPVTLAIALKENHHASASTGGHGAEYSQCVQVRSTVSVCRSKWNRPNVWKFCQLYFLTYCHTWTLNQAICSGVVILHSFTGLAPFTVSQKQAYFLLVCSLDWIQTVACCFLN